MKNAKKLLVLLVVFAMLLSLCACGAQQKQPEEKSAASAAEGAASAEKTRIEVWHRASADMGANVLEEAGAEFNASQDSFEIVPVYNSGEYKGLIQQMVADAASGSTPGICQISYTWSNFLCENFPTTDIASLEGGEEFLTAFDSNLVDLCKNPDGSQVVGIPIANSCPIFYYNIEVCQAAGLDTSNLPTTWEEVVEWAKAIVANTDAEGFSFAAPPDFWLEEWLIEANGGEIYTEENGTYVAHFDDEAAVSAMQEVADLYADGTGVFLSGADAIKEAFSSGKLGIMIATIGWSTGFTTSCAFDWQAASVVSCKGNPVTAPVGGSMFCITATDPAVQEGAWQFLQLLGNAKYIEAWSEATGYLPGRADVRESDGFKAYVEEHPYLNAGLNVIDALNTPVAFPGSSALQLQDDFCNARDAIYTGHGTALDVMTALAESANQLMNEG